MGLGKSGGVLGLLDEFADELIADFQRFYGLDLALVLRETVALRRWERLLALIVNLPPESTLKRYLGHATLTETLLDAQVQLIQAHRRSQSKQAARKLRPIELLKRWQERNEIKAVGSTAAAIESQFRALGAVDINDDDGGER